MTTKLNFRISGSVGDSSGRKTPDYVFNQVPWQVESIQSSPSATSSRRSRTLSGASSLASTGTGPYHHRLTQLRGSNGQVKEIELPRSRVSSYDDDEYYSYADSSDYDESAADSSSDDEEEEQEYSSNQRLLLIAFVTFMSFSTTQLFFAFQAESAAMKGDSAAMMVDSLTYLLNFCAERSKHTFNQRYVGPTSGIITPALAQYLKQRTKRKTILQLEIIPPLISVSTLLVVTVIVFRDSLRVIWWDLSENASHKQGDPNIDLMMIFAIVNVGLDFVNFACFARSSHLFGFNTDVVVRRGRQGNHNNSNNDNSYFSTQEDQDNDDFDDEEDDDDLQWNNGTPFDEDEKAFMNNNSQRSHNQLRRHRSHANLNMCSAYTHVFADTLRSVAVIVAAALAELFDEVTAEEADAAAALVVSLLILLSLIPLFQGLVQSLGALWAIRAEERSEAMTDEIKQEERKRIEKFWNEGKVEW